jgi:isocitrate lyase
MTTDDAYETAMELLEFADMIWVSGETDRLEEAEEAYRQAVAIRDEYLP